MDSLSRWISKADAYVSGYLRTMNAVPSKHNVCLALSVAEFETRCGDLAEGNWGGTTVAQLSSEDRQRLFLAGLVPSNPDDLEPARRVLGDRPNMILGQDSDPKSGWYWIWFYHPNSPADGAAYFVKVLVMHRPECKSILEDDNGTADQLARAMYTSHYFAGHFDPHSNDVVYNGQHMTGQEANIEAYRDNLIRIQNNITSNLVDWTPSCGAYDLSNILGLQEALTYLAGKLHRPDLDPKGIDGLLGNDTKQAIRAVQTYTNVKVDGVPGPETKNAILRLIAGLASVTEPAPPPIHT